MEITQSRSSLSSSCLTLHTTTSPWVSVCVCVCVCENVPDLICCYLHTHHPSLLYMPSDPLIWQPVKSSKPGWPMRAHVYESMSVVRHCLTIIPPSQGLQITRLIQGLFLFWLHICHCYCLQGVEWFSPRLTDLRKCSLCSLILSELH